MLARPTTLFPDDRRSNPTLWDSQGKTVETRLDDWVFESNYATRQLETHFRVVALEGFGLTGHPQATAAAGAIVHYLRETSAIGARNSEDAAKVPSLRPAGTGLEHLDRIGYYEQQNAMILDQITARNLELVEPAPGDDASATLVGAIDDTATGMGARLLRAWILRPEISLAEIEERLDAVAELKSRTIAREELHSELEGILDLERLMSRITLGIAMPRDLLALRASLEKIPIVRGLMQIAEKIKVDASGVKTPDEETGILSELKLRPPKLPDSSTQRVAEPAAPKTNHGEGRLRALREQMDELADVRDIIARAIADDPPAMPNDPGVIRRGFHAELDELRSILTDGRQTIAAMEDRERKRTGIGSLKIRYNQVFGYYIEVSKPNLALVPADYDRKQTLVNAERFTSNELAGYERKVLSAEERALEIERRLYGEIREAIAREAGRMRRSAAAIAQLDVLVNFARIAAARNYSRPRVHGNTSCAKRPARIADGGGRTPPRDRETARGARRAVCAERSYPGRGIAVSAAHYRTEHGRQVHIPTANGADFDSRANGIVRARG